jgi:hypothetical protein
MDPRSPGELVALMQPKPANQFQTADFRMLRRDALTLEVFSGEWDSQTKKLLLFRALTLLACAIRIEVVS